jgi:hypothetical protein
MPDRHPSPLLTLGVTLLALACVLAAYPAIVHPLGLSELPYVDHLHVPCVLLAVLLLSVASYARPPTKPPSATTTEAEGQAAGGEGEEESDDEPLLAGLGGGRIPDSAGEGPGGDI